jgi:TetR/AcrR family transcriptional regulator, mexJK operon transcriptional repressor
MDMKTPPAATARPAPGRPKDAAKHDGIVRAATALFMKDGFTLTSMEAVAKKADVSKITIYSHFANKEELFKAVIQRRCDKLAMPQCYLAHADKPVHETLSHIATNFTALIYSPDSIHLQRIIQSEATRQPQVVKIFYEAGPKRVKEAFGQLLEEWNRRGALAIPDITRATEQFFSLLKGERLSRTMLKLVPRPTPAEQAAHVKATVDFFLAGYRPIHVQSQTGVP